MCATFLLDPFVGLELTTGNKQQELASQGYVCPQCKKAFTTLDAGSVMDPYRQGFFCDVCDHELLDNENEEDVRGSKDRTKRLVEQTIAIVNLLKRMDDVTLPSCVSASICAGGGRKLMLDPSGST